MPPTNTAPYPEPLDDLVAEVGYKSGWHFNLSDIDRGQGSHGQARALTARATGR